MYIFAYTHLHTLIVYMFICMQACVHTHIYIIINSSPMPWQMLFANRYDNNFQISTTDILYLFLTMLLIPYENNEKTIL